MDYDFDWRQSVENLVQLLVAYVLAIPIGWERERHTRSAGLRTFPLVAMGACAFMMIGREVLRGDEAWGRIGYGIITGIGFIGGGAILKSDTGVHGTATAASIWNVGAIGMAVAWERYDIALILCVMNYVTLRCKELYKNNNESSVEKPNEDKDACS